MLSLLLALALSTAIENQKPGTPDWDLTNPALAREIEGYASSTSVNGGDPIDLFVHTTAAGYAIEVFRAGWYGGAGARRVAGPIDRAGIVQEIPAPDPATGLIACAWRDPYRLDTSGPDGPWTSGVYLARLTAHPSGKQSFIVFVVRDDRRAPAMLFQSSVTTFAAYNNWGGKSLYAFNSGNQPARKVSFDRPYAVNPYGVRLDGAGDFLRRSEYNALRFLEREGYDLAYVTDVDTHQRPLASQGQPGPRIFLSVGHDGYWSVEMRRHVEAARDDGVHLVFLGAAACFWKIRFEPGARGDADRTIVSYRDSAGDLDPLAIDGNPQNDRLITGRWRDRPLAQPEERLIGVMYAADPVDADVIVSDPSHWVFDGTGLKNGDALRGLLGNAVDAIHGDSPATLERVAHSPFVERGAAAAGSRQRRFADMTIYTAASGALVFAAGSVQWSWGLDDYNAPGWHTRRVNAAAQQMTRTLLTRMQAGVTVPPRRRTGWPNPIVPIAALVAGAVVLRAWLTRPNRRA